MTRLFELLCCPQTGQSLTPAPAELVARLQASAKAGALKGRGGQTAAPFEAALITMDCSRIYPIRGGIPVLLIQESF